MKIELRKQRITDAKRFFDILNQSGMETLGSTMPKSIEDEKNWLKRNKQKEKNNFEHNYSILADGKVVGGCGIKIDQHRKHIGEIGYFVDQNYWGKGIATKATKILEKIGFQEFRLKRITIIMLKENLASEKVAIKAGYKKEGVMIKSLKQKEKFRDALLYAKVK